MKENKYKEKCDKCGRWTHKYSFIGTELYCEECYLKAKSEEKRNSKKLKELKRECEIVE